MLESLSRVVPRDALQATTARQKAAAARIKQTMRAVDAKKAPSGPRDRTKPEIKPLGHANRSAKNPPSTRG